MLSDKINIILIVVYAVLGILCWKDRIILVLLVEAIRRWLYPNGEQKG